MGIPMVAKKACRYGTRSLRAGDEFTVTGQSHARLYKALNWASEKPPQQPKAEAFSYGEALNPSDPVAFEEEFRKVKRTYKRRDMTAEDKTEE